ncbi:hypothetical protein HMPREF9628_02286 [Peptoanaerobacter stomatis]|uniref:Transposase, IS4 family n=9 Tax=Peptoanaerobacter stomatis TaxID=796937 RepID=G9XG08_9FIRM|nr:hypothetical protein HMPREF9628_02286 [Peptoanaerobacter stomatis]
MQNIANRKSTQEIACFLWYNVIMRKQIPLTEYIIAANIMQLRLNLNIEQYIQDDGKVQLVQNIVERMNIQEIFKNDNNKGRKPSVNPITMLKVIIFCYSEGIYSTRAIEKMCKYDLRVKYILNEEKQVDHSTISRYQKRLIGTTEKLLQEFTQILIEEKLIDLSSVYIDGTKIESNANRYSFVWRKAVEKNKKKLQKKIIKKLELEEGISEKTIKNRIKQEFFKIKNKCKKEKIEFVQGKGKRKSEEQKEYEELKNYYEKIKQYDKHLRIMKKRNSYAKTDKEATFMRMKEDHMRNGQLKPAYNVQYATSSNFIIGSYISEKPSDMYTLKPFVKKLHKKYNKEMEKIVADAGYESEENYDYLNNKKLKAYIKPSKYKIQKTRKYKKEEEERQKLIYDKEKDTYQDENRKIYIRIKDKIRKRESGYKSKTKVYKCFDYNTNGQKTKTYYFTEKFEKYRKQSQENIQSEEGINERINRSIQAEGVFSKLKEGLGYKRFRHKGKKNIEKEIDMMAIAININTLLNKLKRKETKPTRYEKIAA